MYLVPNKLYSEYIDNAREEIRTMIILHGPRRANSFTLSGESH